MKKVSYSTKKGAELSLELPTVANKPVEVTNSFVRIDKTDGSGKMRKPVAGEVIDLEAENTHVFWTIEIDGHKAVRYCISLEQLNNKPGFKESIDIDNGAASFKAGAKITVSGSEMSFKVA